MIKQFIEAWNENKGDLEEYFRTHIQSEYDNYKALVIKIFDIVINPYLFECYKYDTEKITEIDDGHYQGTQIFLLHRATYQPSVEDYVYTHTYYGSCNGCDTLLSIQDWGYDCFPSDNQVKDYMALCLHLIEKCRFMAGEENEK